MTLCRRVSVRTMSAKLKEDAKLVLIPDAEHFDIVDPRSRAWAEVEKVVLRAVKA